MPLEIFAIIVPLGIALIVLVVKFSGLSKTAMLEDGQQALSVFEEDFGGEAHKGKSLLTQGGKAAFIQMVAPDKLGLVEAIGDRFISRVLGKNDLRFVETRDGNGLEIRFNDFTHPRGKYIFSNGADKNTVDAWLAKLEK